MSARHPKPIHPGDFVDCGNGFWNARGSFRIAGVLEGGTHASLVAMEGGRFLWLDSVTLTGDALDGAMALTDGGKKVDAILNLHPFHTMHCEWAHRQFPGARLYGTARHKAQLPGLKWEEELVEGEGVAARFAGLLDLSVPRGIDFISTKNRVHTSSVLALHKASGTVHSDDTLSYTVLPFPIRLLKEETAVFFHPRLPAALEERPGAAAEFRVWARALAERWSDARRLCAAHNGIRDLPERDFGARVLAALARVEPVLAKHEARFG
jgi:hypothetical protein